MDSNETEQQPVTWMIATGDAMVTGGYVSGNYASHVIQIKRGELLRSDTFAVRQRPDLFRALTTEEAAEHQSSVQL